jgi:hypothetical protein
MKLSKNELIQLVEKIMNTVGTEEELDEMLLLLKGSVPHPEVSDLIFWNDKDLTAEEIINEALTYKPIILP